MYNKTHHIASLYKPLQTHICRLLEEADGEGKFQSAHWEKELGSGITRIMQNGRLIEKAGVNFSQVGGALTPALEKALEIHGGIYSATGISSIIHPSHPWIPIIHMNVRYFELDNGKSWFGGGIDLTPHYVIPADAHRFHRELKMVCDKYNTKFYPEFKSRADDYFFLHHRRETRGVGGIFFDRIDPEDYELTMDQMIAFTEDLCRFYPKVYARLMEWNKNKTVTSDNLKWQALRRSRYVEFNLLYDRGTKFGLASGGNTESILISMPPAACWEYDYRPPGGSEEDETLALLKKDIDWIHYNT